MTLRAPFRCLRIMSIAFSGGQPLFTKAKATSKGALPSPATQCTPILPSLLVPTYFCLSGVYCALTGSSLLSSTIASKTTFSSRKTSPSACFYYLWWGSFGSKNSLTIPSHLDMTGALGSCPSGKFRSYTRQHYQVFLNYLNFDAFFYYFFLVVGLIAAPEQDLHVVMVQVLTSRGLRPQQVTYFYAFLERRLVRSTHDQKVVVLVRNWSWLVVHFI